MNSGVFEVGMVIVVEVACYQCMRRQYDARWRLDLVSYAFSCIVTKLVIW